MKWYSNKWLKHWPRQAIWLGGKEIAKTPGHLNDMHFISFATPFHILFFIGFNEISMQAFSLCI
jgi:hypothetical protein